MFYVGAIADTRSLHGTVYALRRAKQATPGTERTQAFTVALRRVKQATPGTERTQAFTARRRNNQAVRFEQEHPQRRVVQAPQRRVLQAPQRRFPQAPRRRFLMSSSLTNPTTPLKSLASSLGVVRWRGSPTEKAAVVP
jgi:hypothetical protein